MWKIFILILVILGVGGTYFMISRDEPRRQGNFQIGEAILSVEIVEDFAKQYQGLSGRKTLCQNCGMLFVFEKPKPQNFVMRGMNFSLDFVFINRGRVVELVDNIPSPKQGAQPAQIISTAPADMVLEVNAGSIAKNNLKIGDQASLRLDQQ